MIIQHSVLLISYKFNIIMYLYVYKFLDFARENVEILIKYLKSGLMMYLRKSGIFQVMRRLSIKYKTIRQ